MKLSGTERAEGGFLRRTFKAYALQFETVECDFEGNYNRFLTLFNFCSKNSLVVLPEVFPTGFCYSDIAGAVRFSKKVVEDIISFSKGLELVVVFSVMEMVNGKLYNSVKVIDSGREVFSRPKVKLFPLTGEAEHFTAGNFDDLKVAETSLCRVAPVVCFELRFSEIFSILKSKGAEVFAVVAQWGRARREHWKVLNVARAIEFQRFVISANGTGEMAGSSVIVDPWGRTLVEGGTGIGLISADVDLLRILKVEQKLPLMGKDFC